MNRYCFWLNTPSPHQMPMIIAFSKIFDGRVYIVTTKTLRQDRVKQGLRPLTMPSSINFIDIEDNSNSSYLIKLVKCKNTGHFFTGINAYKSLTPWFKKVYRYNPSQISIFLEPYCNIGFKKYARSFKYRFLSRKYLKIKQILTTSGVEQYSRCGFENVKQFGYFVDNSNYSSTLILSKYKKNDIRICYVGRISRQKGIDQLLVSLSNLKSNGYKLLLDLYGMVVDHEIKKLAEDLHLEDRVSFQGVLPNDIVRNRLEEYDAFIFPTNYDGWGVAVSEAALAGLPVYVSDNAGVSNYIDGYQFAHIFNVSEIDNIICKILGKGNLSNLVREKNRAEANIMTADYGARLLMRYISD